MPERKYLGLRHIFQGEEVDSTVKYTSRIEFLRCSESLKSFNHCHSSSRVLDLLALLVLLPVPFPDTYRYWAQTNVRRRSSTLVHTTDMRYQRDHPEDRGSSALTIIMVILLIGESQLESVGNNTALVSLCAFEQVPIALEN